MERDAAFCSRRIGNSNKIIQMKGFFTAESDKSKARIPLVAQCGACGLRRHCNSPLMPVSGEGRKGIFVLGEAPGKSEDLRNEPFVGKSGQLLESTLAKFGVDLRRDCFIGNSLICRPHTASDK